MVTHLAFACGNLETFYSFNPLISTSFSGLQFSIDSVVKNVNRKTRKLFYGVIIFRVHGSSVSIFLLNGCIVLGTIFLPAATKLWPRLCFHTCLWFCPQGGFLQAGRTPPDQAEPPRLGDHPPGTSTPPGSGRTPPGIRQNPPGWETTTPRPQDQHPLGSGRTPRTSTPPAGSGRTPPPAGRPPPPWPALPPGIRQNPHPEAAFRIRSMSGRYASYWNAFLSLFCICTMICVMFKWLIILISA